MAPPPRTRALVVVTVAALLRAVAGATLGMGGLLRSETPRTPAMERVDGSMSNAQHFDGEREAGAGDSAQDNGYVQFEKEALKAHMDTIDGAIQTLEDMWPVPGGKTKEFLEAPWGYPSPDQGEALRAKLRARWQQREPFVFASLGSSVTAGHDNYWNQSWPFELERLLAPTFKSVGFDFNVRQRATGGYGEMPYTVGCLETRVGSGVDALNWEWGMFYDNKCEVQQFITEANRLERKPVVFGFQDCSLYDDGNDKRKQKAVAHRKELLRNAETELGEGHWHPNEWYLTEDYVSNEELSNWRAHGLERLDASELTQSGASGESQQYLEKLGLASQFQANGQGWYPLKISFAAPYVKEDAWFAARERAFNINWHPGPLGHRLVASVLGRFLLANLRAVVYDQLHPTALYLDNPAGKKTHTGWNPVVNHASVGPVTGNCGSLTTMRCFTGQMPRREERGYGIESLVEPNPTRWKLGQSIQAPVETAMPQLDLRRAYSGRQEDGELLLAITVPNAGGGDQYALLCQAPCGWDCKEDTGFISIRGSERWKRSDGTSARSSDAAFVVDDQRITDEDLAALHQNLFAEGSGEYCPGCKAAGDVCQPVAKLAPGRHKIGVSVRPEAKNGTILELMQVMLVGFHGSTSANA